MQAQGWQPKASQPSHLVTPKYRFARMKISCWLCNCLRFDHLKWVRNSYRRPTKVLGETVRTNVLRDSIFHWFQAHLKGRL